jgi:predicted O-methyltransferase YrrM
MAPSFPSTACEVEASTLTPAGKPITAGCGSKRPLAETGEGSRRGLLPLSVYRRLYESAACCGTIIEIGTYRGAATTATALGAKSAGGSFTVLTADLLRPGIGLEGATAAAKIEAPAETMRQFGVEAEVQFVHGSTETLVAETDPRDVKLLLLDGGGRLETDLALLWDRLASDAVIVIDDIDGRATVARTLTTASVNQKHVISKLLTDHFVAAGILIPEGRIASTGWYRKGLTEVSGDKIRLMALPAYHQLIRVELGAAEFGLPRMIARAMAARLPGLRRLFRSLRPAR